MINNSIVSKPAYPMQPKRYLGGSGIYCQSTKDFKQYEAELAAKRQQLAQTQEKKVSLDADNQTLLDIQEHLKETQFKLSIVCGNIDSLQEQDIGMQTILGQLQQQFQLQQRDYFNQKTRTEQRQREQREAVQEIEKFERYCTQHAQQIEVLAEDTQKQSILLSVEVQNLQKLKELRDAVENEVEELRQKAAKIVKKMEQMDQRTLEVQIQNVNLKIQQQQTQIDRSTLVISQKEQHLLKEITERFMLYKQLDQACPSDHETLLQQLGNCKGFCELGEDYDYFKQKLKSQSSKTLEKLDKLHQIISQTTQTLDFAELNERYSRAQAQYSKARSKYQKGKQQLDEITPLAAKQLIRLAELRQRAETEMRYWFSQQTSLLNLQVGLEFKMPPLPNLQKNSISLETLDDDTKIQYLALFGEQVQNNLPEVGKIEICSQQRQVNSFSGGEGTFTALSFITSCCKVIQSAYLQIDEWDVFMDAGRRTNAFKMLMEVVFESGIQCVLVTPNDVDLSVVKEMNKKDLIGIVRLEAIARE